jgi:hypothetical protein
MCGGMMLPARPSRVRQYASTTYYGYAGDDLSTLSCPPWKAVVCAGAVTGCLLTPTPVQCILAVAPHCIDCLPR